MSHQTAVPGPGITAIIAALAVMGCLGQSQTAISAPAQGTRHTVEITDPATHSRAFTLQVPTGWKFAGMLVRPGGCHPPSVPAAGLSYTVLAPDGITAYEKLPGVTWSWASDGSNPGNPKCAPIRLTKASEFLLNIAIPNMRPDAKNISMAPISGT